MDLKEIQKEMKNCILKHQNKDLKADLVKIQQNIATLGKKQKEILKKLKATKGSSNNINKKENHTISTANINKTSSSAPENSPLDLVKTKQAEASALNINGWHKTTTAEKTPQNNLVTTPSSEIVAMALQSTPNAISTDALSAVSKYLNQHVSMQNSTNLKFSSTQKILPKNTINIKQTPVITTCNKMIVFPQSNSNTQGKQLYARLLPKGKQAISSQKGKKSLISTPIILQKRSGNITQNLLPNAKLIITSTGTVQQSLPITITQSSPTFITKSAWQKQDVPKQPTQPNILKKSTGKIMSTSAYQKFRICDGKPQPIPTSPEKAIISISQTYTTAGGNPGKIKPRNDVLKEVLAQAKAFMPEKSRISISQQVPKQHEGFIPLTSITGLNLITTVIQSPNNNSRQSTSSSFKPIRQKPEIIQIDDDKDIVFTESAISKEQQSEYMRNLELIPKELARKIISRRFSKRKVAANPVYSGGIYVAHNPLKRTPSPSKSLSDSDSGPARKTRNRQKAKQQDIIKEESHKLKNAHQTVEPVKTEFNDNLIIDESANSNSANVIKMKSKRKRRRKTSEEQLDGHDDQCNVCNEAGEVLMCDTCSLVYHLKCCTPPLLTVPQGMWVCSRCVKQFKNTKCVSPWPKISNVVHSYHIYNRKMLEEIASLTAFSNAVKKTRSCLELQTKQLTESVKMKVGVRTKTMREGKAIEEKLHELSSIVRILNKRTNTQEEKNINNNKLSFNKNTKEM